MELRYLCIHWNSSPTSTYWNTHYCTIPVRLQLHAWWCSCQDSWRAGVEHRQWSDAHQYHRNRGSSQEGPQHWPRQTLPCCYATCNTCRNIHQDMYVGLHTWSLGILAYLAIASERFFLKRSLSYRGDYVCKCMYIASNLALSLALANTSNTQP